MIPTGAIQLATAGGSQGVVGGDGQTISALAMTNTPGGGAVVQYATQGQDGQFFVPGEPATTVPRFGLSVWFNRTPRGDQFEGIVLECIEMTAVPTAFAVNLRLTNPRCR